MTDDPSDERDVESATTTPDEWIDRIAESEGISRDEVVEQLVSSYWTLKEMHGLMEHSEEDLTAEATELSLDVETLLSEALSGDMAEITDRLDRLEAGLVDEESAGSVEEVDARVEMLAQRIAAVEEALRSRQDTLQSRFDEEFDNLETILSYLIDATDDLEARIESVVDEQEADRAHRDEQERLVELKRLASRLGVRRAKCEYCDAAVEIALLPTPDCPQCDRRFTDIQPSKRWFGLGKDVLTVSGEPYLEDADGDQPSEDSPGDGGEGTGGTFRWGENR